MSKRQLFSFLCALAVAAPAFAHPGGVNAPSTALPPIVPDNEYLSPADVHARYAGGALEIVLTRIEHQPFAGQPPENFPDREVHHFPSEVRGEVSINGGPLLPFMANGNVDTVAFGRSPGPGQLGTFDTEMLAMTLVSNFPGVMIRESPTKASLGKTSVTDIGGGLYHIDSFFDVFTELSVDGGQTWMESVDATGASASTHVVLGIPEPASLVLLAIALLGACGVTRRR